MYPIWLQIASICHHQELSLKGTLQLLLLMMARLLLMGALVLLLAYVLGCLTGLTRIESARLRLSP